MTSSVDAAREYNFDGLVGPTHSYAGLSVGNLASMIHRGKVSNPRRAALEGLAKMRYVHAQGVGQAVLPPHDRPSLGALRRLGFRGADEQMLSDAALQAPALLRLVTSAAAMWTANAATVAPSSDTADGRLHLTPANLHALFHRSIEASVTERVLRATFADASLFAVHQPLPGGGHFADEGAANHTRFFSDEGQSAHLFGWGRAAFEQVEQPRRYVARQTREASQAVARLHQLDSDRIRLAQQHPEGIDAGAFHSDVLAVGAGAFLMMHERAFVDPAGLERWLSATLGASTRVAIASSDELPLEDAVTSYAFNSQLLTTSAGLIILAPEESLENNRARAFLEGLVARDNPVERVEYLDLRQSMNNGGGPACLRLRIPLTETEVAGLSANLLFGPRLDGELTAWVLRHYRDRLDEADLRDPALMRESFTALDELTDILKLGSLYDFQRPM
jgi:succinylarginine dihydrolase